MKNTEDKMFLLLMEKVSRLEAIVKSLEQQTDIYLSQEQIDTFDGNVDLGHDMLKEAFPDGYISIDLPHTERSNQIRKALGYPSDYPMCPYCHEPLRVIKGKVTCIFCRYKNTKFAEEKELL